MVAHSARSLVQGLLDLVFAPRCLGCGGAISTAAPDRRVCATCWTRMRPPPAPRCDRCGTPRPTSPVLPLDPRSCPTCALLPPSLRAVRSAYVMEGPSRRLVHALKYGGWRAVAGAMGERMASVALPLEAEEEVRIVVPVPLSTVRLRQRGYNQAEVLAREVARRRGCELQPDLLQRRRATDSQATLHPAERRANVAGAFGVRPGREASLRGEHLLLVDDVWTTGATALACCAALVAGGARAVSVLTFARALPELHR